MSHARVAIARRIQARRLVLVLFSTLVLVGAAAATAQPFGTIGLVYSPGYPGSSGWFEVPASPALNPTGAFTIEAWVAITNNSSGEDCRSIAGKNYLQAWWIGQCNVAGQPTLRSYLKGGGSLRNGGIIPRNVLTHIAVTFDGAFRRHYINGELAAAFAETGPLATSSDPLRIGSDVSWPRSPTGFIDEVRLWNVARTTAQIRSKINVPITTPQPGLVAVWNLPGLTNVIGGGHNGTLQGTGLPPPLPPPAILSCGSSTASALCLQTRFFVTAKWRTNPTPGTPTDGDAHVVGAGPNSGVFWFFSSDNWEIMVKAINGCPLNNRYWIYSAAITDVFFRMEVTDVGSGLTKVYFNYPGTPAPAITDSSAFATCP